MYQETEALLDEIVIIAEYRLNVTDKNKNKIILDRYIANKDLAIKLFNEQVNHYHNSDKRVSIFLYDINKCINIESYDSDDNI